MHHTVLALGVRCFPCTLLRILDATFETEEVIEASPEFSIACEVWSGKFVQDEFIDVIAREQVEQFHEIGKSGLAYNGRLDAIKLPSSSWVEMRAGQGGSAPDT